MNEQIKTKLTTGRELAVLICEAINDSETHFRAKLWDKKSGETRVYVSYPTKKGPKDCGHICVMDHGKVYRQLTLQAGTIENLYSDLLQKYEVVPVLESRDSLTQAVKKVVEECWECGARYTTYGNVEAGNMGCRRCN